MSEKKTGFCLFIIIAFGFFIRVIPFFEILTSGEVTFLQSDQYYYLRRIKHILENLPKVPVFDYYLTYPQKIDLPSPPFYPLFLALLSKVITFGSVSNSELEIITAVFTAFLGGMVALPVFLISKKIIDNKLALTTAFLSTMMVPHYWYTSALAGDHHSVETFLGLLAINFFIENCFRSDKKRIIYLTLSLTGLFLVWQGAILYIIFFTSALLILIFFRYEINKNLIVSTGLSTILYLSLILIFPPVNFSISYGLYSYAGIASIIFFLNFLLTLYFFQKNMKYFFYISLITNLLTVTIIIKSVIGGFQFISGTEKWFTMSMEMESMYDFLKRTDYRIPRKVLENALMMSQILLSAMGAFFMLKDFLKEKRSLSLFFVSFLTILFFLLATIRVRFNYVFSAFMVISAIYLLRERAILRKIFVVISIFYITLFIYLVYQRYEKEETGALKWLRDNTPLPEIEKGEVPRYSVHTLWDDSYRLVYIANRPSIVNGSLILAGKEQFLDHILIMATDELNEFITLLDKHKIRYLYYDSHTKYLGSMYFNLLKRKYVQAIHRVYNSIGFNNGFYRDRFLENIRIVYSYFDKEKNRTSKIFEYVKGARLVVKTKPNINLTISISVNLDNSSFNYIQEKKTDSKGEALFIVPYSTWYNNQVKTGAYEITDGKKSIQINIKEEDVLEGKDLSVNF